MFPKLFSSSCEISSKCNAFVQNKDIGNESVVSLSSSSPDDKVPEMWDELLVNCGESRKEVPDLTVITGHPSQTHSVHHTSLSVDSVAENMSSQPGESGVDDTGVLSVVLSRKVSDNTTSDKPDIPRTNDTDLDESFKVCDYYSRWGIERGRLRGGGESGVAAAGAQSWGQTGGGNQGGPGGWSGGPQAPQHRQNNNTQAGPSSQQSQAQGGGGNQPGNQNPSQSSSGQQGPAGGSQQQQQGPANQGSATNQPGGPTASQPNNNNNNQTGGGSNNNNNQQPGANQPNQQPGTGTNQPNNNNGWNKPGGQQPGATGGGAGGNQPQQPTSTKQQMEQLNSMREALFSQDGWGGQNVNQDSNWDIPGSPEPGAKETMPGAPPPMWKPNVNNGTDLWEANLRNGGIVAPPAAPVPKAQMSHTPTSHIGGVWGEEDEGDFSNMWTGVPPAGGGQTPGGAGPPQWPTGPAGPQPPAVWPGKKEGDWGGPGGGQASGWGDQRHDMRPDVIRCDQRGISGRLNGEAMWPHHHHKVPGGAGGGPGGGGGNWNTGVPPPLKEMSLGKPSGWEEPSPPAQRRTMPNYDDGTSLWGQQNRPAMPGQGKVSHWKDLPSGGQPMGRGGMQCPPGARNPNMKPDQGGPMWHPQAPGGGPRNGWDSGVDQCWGDADKPAAAPWLDQQLPPTWQGAAANKLKHPWEPDIDPNPASSWGMHPSKQPAAKTNKEYMWTRPYRMLTTDIGYKKEDLENALRNNSMGVEDSLDPTPGWGGRRGHDGLDGPGEPHNLFSGGPAQVCIPFQAGPAGPPPGPLPQAPRQPQTTQQPSTQQLRMLVQQIQAAVHAGYLQQQILNQPLAPQTLFLLNQLLQQIKALQQVQQMYSAQQNNMKPVPNHLLLQTQVKITQIKQQIGSLQNQITNQQAIYMNQPKQQVQAQAQQMQPPPQSQQNDPFRTNNMHDPLSTLNSNFPEITLKDSPMVNSLSYPTGGTGQSRLNQWKLPILEKDSDVGVGGGGEFSRAPGSKGGAGGGGSPLLPDGGWSSREPPTSWPPSDTSSDPSSDPSKDWPTGPSQPAAFSDLVPEFKPGEPWKGNPMKTTDDDPTLTPSSIVRSPLVLPSINVKDSMLGGGPSVQGKSSPTSSDLMPTIPSLSLSTSTWTFNPPTQPQTSTSSMLNKLGGSGGGNKSGGGGWGETTGAEPLWSGGGAGGKGRPPPGLGGTKPGATPTSTNGWSVPQRWSGATAPQPTTNWNASTWLLLRNLTPQIDGSTLKTLCLQHGPLLNFHLFLNNGIALARYSSREEAQKAQGALNNCVLGNTTIFAENPSDQDVMPLVTHLQNQGGGGGGSSGGSSGGGGGGGGSGAGTPWRTPTPGSSAASQLWSSSTSSLWGADTPTTTNSSFLPADLGGESM